ncbi:hypothetical protein Saso_26600 [Streptomyces asoensis]|uniref:Uncharacterized protein n=1 Tax=Streptomyces asoensis TaxID=249586 RepID=A0ABQ3RYR1_9ACTN|nr:hypothetical protein GCM10010496_08180 [Streptomyces asoensis]GHI61010.1 hypothetical protein Saso_26600 [Streptomyces asoensis]
MVQGVQVERTTVRTTWTPWAASARLCLGRRGTGWELPALATNRTALANGAPAILEPERPRRRHVLNLRVTPLVLPAARSAPPGAASRGEDRRQAAPQRRRAARACAGP